MMDGHYQGRVAAWLALHLQGFQRTAVHTDAATCKHRDRWSMLQKLCLSAFRLGVSTAWVSDDDAQVGRLCARDVLIMGIWWCVFAGARLLGGAGVGGRGGAG